MTISEKIRLLLLRRKMTITALAGKMGISRQYLTLKLKKEDFTISELQTIAAALNCKFDSGFTMKDTGERV